MIEIPGLMLAATIASVHMTVVLLRRYSVPFQVGRLWPVIGFLLVCLVRWTVFGVDGNTVLPLPWLAVIPVACAGILITRMGSRWMCWVAAITGFTLASMIHTSYWDLVRGGEYTDQRVSHWREDKWDAGLKQVVSGLEGSTVPVSPFTRKLKEGYLDEVALPDDFRVLPGPMHWVESRPEWHTWFSGLSRISRQTYRIWSPGGIPSVAVANLWLVPWDPRQPVPHGAEKRVGIPARRFLRVD